VFSTALGLNSSKWQQALIDKGLATYAGINYQTNRYIGPIQIMVVPNPTKLKECYTELMNQIAQFSDPNYLTDEQLQTAKEILIRNEIRSNEKPSSLSMNLTYWWASTSLDYFTDYVPNMMKVTKQDITNYVNKYIKAKPFVAGMIISPEMNKQLAPGEYFKGKDF
jgi:zinc protease